MKLEVAYCTRGPRDLPDAHYPDALALAEACDALVVIVPGGAETAGFARSFLDYSSKSLVQAR